MQAICQVANYTAAKYLNCGYLPKHYHSKHWLSALSQLYNVQYECYIRVVQYLFLLKCLVFRNHQNASYNEGFKLTTPVIINHSQVTTSSQLSRIDIHKHWSVKIIY